MNLAQFRAFLRRQKNAEDGTLHLVDVFGKDEELLTSAKKDSCSTLFSSTCVVRFSISCRKTVSIVNLECANFREQANEALIALAEKLKGIALSKGKSVYFRALPPKDRKVIHQYLAEDGRVKSRSIGEGHFKKIKIYPAKSTDTGNAGGGGGNEEYDSPEENFGNR